MDTTIHNKFGDLLYKLKLDIDSEYRVASYEESRFMNKESLLFKNREEIETLYRAYENHEIPEQIVIDRLENIVQSITSLGDDTIAFTEPKTYIENTISKLKAPFWCL